MDSYITGGSREWTDASHVRPGNSLANPSSLLLTRCRTFMTLKEPSIFFRGLILGAQGVFYNLFCSYLFFSPTFYHLIVYFPLVLAYLISPRSCHRFVGYLEEEAVYTYSHCIKEIEAGRIPEWYVWSIITYYQCRSEYAPLLSGRMHQLLKLP